jgi:hypothetical protein
MAIFFSVLSTYLLLRFVLVGTKKTQTLLAYGGATILSLFLHHNTIWLFLIHGVFFLFIVRDKKDIVSYLLCSVVVGAAFGFWLFGFGRAGMGLMHYCDHAFTAIALTVSNPYDYSKDILPMNSRNLIVYLLNDYAESVNFYFFIHFLNLKYFTPVFIFSVAVILFAIASGTKNLKWILIFLLALGLAGFVNSSVMAILAHHTYSFKIRYLVFSVPYIIILVSIGLSRIFQMNSKIKSAIGLLFLFLITGSSIDTIQSIFFNPPPLIHNPNFDLAKRIERQYGKNDTVVYPNWRDAQFTNLYLKNRPDIIQIVDITTSYPSKVFLHHSGKEAHAELFDFSDYKYRY